MIHDRYKEWIIHKGKSFSRGYYYWICKHNENDCAYIYITTKNTVMNRDEVFDTKYDKIRNDLFIFKSIEDAVAAIDAVTNFIKEEEFEV